MSLAGVGCDGELEAAVPTEPSYFANRVTYLRPTSGGLVQEWYVTGPMGLEQGFTLPERPACAAKNSNVLLEVAFRGLKVSVNGDALALEGQGGQVYRYSDLYASDATGTSLLARMEPRGEDRIRLVVDVSQARFPVQVDPLVGVQQAKFLPVSGAAYDWFGYAVAVSGDTALVGAPANDDLDVGAGAAYVFERTGASWSQQAKLLASDGAVSDEFGYSVALSGDTALIGAWLDQDQGFATGSAYVFERKGSTWFEQAKLVASDQAGKDYFGHAVALSGDTALVGALQDDDKGENSGSAYVFQRTGSSWSQQAKLVASDGLADDEFGTSVALDGDTAVVGAPRNFKSGGAAYAFVRTGTTWSQQAKLLPTVTGTTFGMATSLSGETALIGAPASTGSVYAFVRSGASWSLQWKLDASALGNKVIGNAVAIRGDTAVVGVPHEDGGGIESGSVYVYKRIGATWAVETKVAASDGKNYDRLGASVALDGNTVVTGTFGDDKGVDSGSAYAFLLELRKGNGHTCKLGDECVSGFCTDGVCCDVACAGGANDCQACSAAAGAPSDGSCTVLADATVCDDGDGCTQTDTCKAGTCSGANPVVCVAEDDCHEVGGCDSLTGSCSNPSKTDGTLCSGGTCQAGACLPDANGGTAGTAGAPTGGFGGISAGGSGGPSDGGTGSGATGVAGYSPPALGSSEGGCGCRVNRRRDDSSLALLLVALGLTVVARRRSAASQK
ncbi:MAG: FG-GAP repeat protein [Polyangiaceae bacterium]